MSERGFIALVRRFLDKATLRPRKLYTFCEIWLWRSTAANLIEVATLG